MSIDDKVSRDPRITILAAAIGWSRRETLGCLILDVWAICYDQEAHLISERIIDAAAGHIGFARAMVESDLAALDRSGKIRIKGAKERIRYLDHKRDAGRQGGLKSAETRRNAPKQTSSTGGSTPQAVGNPSASATPSASALPSVSVEDQEKNSARLSGGGSPGLLALKAKVDAATGDIGQRRARRPKPSDPTADERAAAMFVLQKLGSRSGVQYSGAGEHIRLIVAQLRDGVSEQDLRKVIGYCAMELQWADKPEMAKYLRPETLFGPKTIARYLDPARAWFAKQPGLAFDERPAAMEAS